MWGSGSVKSGPGSCRARAMTLALGASSAATERLAALLDETPDELKIGHVVELPVVGFALQRQRHLVYARDKALGPVEQSFLQFVRDGSWKESTGYPLNTD
jgi:hypothetical protein